MYIYVYVGMYKADISLLPRTNVYFRGSTNHSAAFPEGAWLDENDVLRKFSFRMKHGCCFCFCFEVRCEF